MNAVKKSLRLATEAQLDYIVKLKSSTMDAERIPIPLYMDKASEMIKRLQKLRTDQKEAEVEYRWDCNEGAYEDTFGGYMWGCY